MKKQKGTRKKHARTHRNTRRVQRGGIKCDEPTTWAPISYSSNSCWLDTFLLAFLHHPNTAIDTYLSDASEHIETNQHDIILQRLLKIRSRLRGVFSESINGRALAKVRENIRTALSTCPTGDIFAKGKMSSTGEIFNYLSTIFKFPNTIRYAEKQAKSNQKEGAINYISLSGFDIMNISEIILSNILTKVKKHLDERHPERSIVMQYKRFGDIVPINIERDDYEGGIITTPVKLEEYIGLKTASNIVSTYRLVSVICNVGGHFISYLACDNDDTWVFYNDLNEKSKRIINVGNIDSWWGKEIPDFSDRYPVTHSTWFLYIKI
jgi:hypothetical protein